MIQVLERAATILDLLRREEGLSFTEVWKGSGLNKATASNILKSLATLGFAEKGGDDRYRLGPKVVELARPLLRGRELLGAAEECVAALAERVRETATVSALRHGERCRLAKAECGQSVAVDVGYDTRAGLWSTATGRVLAAHADADELALILEHNGLPGDVWPEARTRRRLTGLLKRIRKEGLCEAPSRDGQAVAVATPVFGPAGEFVAALGVAVPSYRYEGKRREAALTELKAAARRMGEALRLRWPEPAARGR